MMRARILALLPLLLGAAPLPVQDLSGVDAGDDSALGVPRGARLVFADDFDGLRLDPAKWAFQTERNKDGWYNDEAQYYSRDPANVRVERGRLVMEARAGAPDKTTHPDWGGQRFTSGRIASRQSWTYGFYEIAAKLPCGRGTWPALWMLPGTSTAPWPEGGEIDIMEMVGWNPQVVHATVHTGLFNHVRHTQRGASRSVATSCSAFHRYQLDWTPDAIRIGVDGRSFMRFANNGSGRGAWPFDTPFQLLLNVAVGGSWGGAKGIDTAALPQRMEVDYVRVWQRPR